MKSVQDSAALWTLVPAAGTGSRMGAARPKQYLPLLGEPVIVHTLRVLLSHPRISSVHLILDPEDPYWPSIGLSQDPRILRVAGGAERCYSVLNGLEAIAPRARPDDWVLVHDVARPCLRREDLDRLLDELWTDPVGGLLALPVADTLKRADGEGRVETTLDRRQTWRAFTPQMFRFGRLHQALREILARGEQVTDEASALERLGLRPRLVQGHGDNIKITLPDDLDLAEALLRQRRARLNASQSRGIESFQETES